MTITAWAGTMTTTGTWYAPILSNPPFKMNDTTRTTDSLTIDQVLVKKQALRLAINNLLDDFGRSTGVKIESIYVSHRGIQPSLHIVELEARL